MRNLVTRMTARKRATLQDTRYHSGLVNDQWGSIIQLRRRSKFFPPHVFCVTGKEPFSLFLRDIVEKDHGWKNCANRADGREKSLIIENYVFHGNKTNV